MTTQFSSKFNSNAQNLAGIVANESVKDLVRNWFLRFEESKGLVKTLSEMLNFEFDKFVLDYLRQEISLGD